VPDPGLLGALFVIGAFASAVVLLIWRERSGGRRRGSGTHAMERDDSVSYFRDFSSSASAPGVREEDRAGRWGEDDPKAR
jgi:hypothetical protein